MCLVSVDLRRAHLLSDLMMAEHRHYILDLQTDILALNLFSGTAHSKCAFEPKNTVNA